MGVHPVLFVLDRDAPSLSVFLTVLTRRFGNDFTVAGEVSPDAALATLGRLAASMTPVALLLVDARAEEFLTPAHVLHPSAKRVLALDRDYSSTSPAVAAMALGRADFHIVRPWSDEEMVLGAISEYLMAWTREQEPRFEMFRIIARPDDPETLELRDTMTRFTMPFGMYESESHVGKRLLLDAGLDGTRLPVMIRYDGQVTVRPNLPDLARAIGVNVTVDVGVADLVIIGAGPAGLSAAVYAASEGLETVVLEQAVSGGQAGTSPLIRNYPGFPHGVNGGVLMERSCEQAWLMGAHIVFTQEVVALSQRGAVRVVHLSDGTSVLSKTVVIATGVAWRRLGIANLEGLLGAGVFYGAAVSESRAMRGQRVFIVGAGNSAGQAALHLARYARTVTMLVRGTDFAASMSDYLVRAIRSTPNIFVRHRTRLEDGGGSGRLEELVLGVTEVGRSTTERVPASALFVMIGGEPHTGWLPPGMVRNSQGYLITGRELLGAPGSEWPLHRDPLPLETSVPGIFAAGDVRSGSMNRVASAVGDGATAVRLVHDYLAGLEPNAPPPTRAGGAAFVPLAAS